jgi:hypothetical protein
MSRSADRHGPHEDHLLCELSDEEFEHLASELQHANSTADSSQGLTV